MKTNILKLIKNLRSGLKTGEQNIVSNSNKSNNRATAPGMTRKKMIKNLISTKMKKRLIQRYIKSFLSIRLLNLVTSGADKLQVQFLEHGCDKTREKDSSTGRYWESIITGQPQLDLTLFGLFRS